MKNMELYKEQVRIEGTSQADRSPQEKAQKQKP